LERSAQRALQALYARLMAPVVDLLATLAPMPAHAPRKLVVVPHRQLYSVPFHALYDGQRYLIDFCELSYAPSATVFQLCQQRHIPTAGAAWVLGIADARIPSVTDETDQVSAHLRQHFNPVHIWLNSAAVRQNLPTATANCAVLHLACHGIFRDDNPLFSALKLANGWLTAADVMQMTFNGTLVTLSACESGRSQALVVDEIVGLSYAFFSAGAATLMVSQWLVHDQAATLLMDVCYRQLNAGADLAAALRLAQLAVKAQYPHPYFWAPFVLLGGRDGYKF
jgi:CHAT domain-containing protein